MLRQQEKKAREMKSHEVFIRSRYEEPSLQCFKKRILDYPRVIHIVLNFYTQHHPQRESENDRSQTKSQAFVYKIFDQTIALAVHLAIFFLLLAVFVQFLGWKMMASRIFLLYIHPFTALYIFTFLFDGIYRRYNFSLRIQNNLEIRNSLLKARTRRIFFL